MNRGYTLIELMISVALLVPFTAMVAGLGSQAHQEHRNITGYQRDLLESRRVIRSVEADLRAAITAERIAGGIEVRRRDDVVRYRVQDGELWRHGSRGGRAMARCIERIDVTTRGTLAEVALHMRRRSGPGRSVRLGTTIELRNAEAP